MFLLEVAELKENFGKYFEVGLALSEPLKHECYHIRHSVYCSELGYERTNSLAEEKDDYDDRSWHVLLKARRTDSYVGCARMVRVCPDAPLMPLPFERICEHSIDRSIVDPRQLDRNTMVELSRLAVLSDYRKRKGEEKVPISISDEDMGTTNRPRFPYIPVGLYLALLAIAKQRGIDNMFTLTEPRLSRHLSALGFRMKQIGTGVEHRGIRVPSWLVTSDVYDHLPTFMRPLYELIFDQVTDAFALAEQQRSPAI